MISAILLLGTYTYQRIAVSSYQVVKNLAKKKCKTACLIMLSLDSGLYTTIRKKHDHVVYNPCMRERSSVRVLTPRQKLASADRLPANTLLPPSLPRPYMQCGGYLFSYLAWTAGWRARTNEPRNERTLCCLTAWQRGGSVPSLLNA